MKPQFFFVDSVPDANTLFNWEEEYWYYMQGDGQFALPVIGRQISFIYLQRLALPRPMRYNLTSREDSVKIGSLKYGDGFRQEGLYGINIVGLRPGFVNEDVPVNEVDVIPNTFGSELAKNDAQYPDLDTRFLGRIKSANTQWWARLVDLTLVTFGERLQEMRLYTAVRASKYGAEICASILYSILELYNSDSNTFL